MHFGAQLRGLRAPCERFAPWVTPGPRITRFRLAADLGRMGLDTHRVSNKVSRSHHVLLSPLTGLSRHTRCCVNRNWHRALPRVGSSPIDRARLWSTKLGHSIEHVARKHRFDSLRCASPTSKSIAENRLVPEERVLDAGLSMIADLLLPSTAPNLADPSDRPIASARPRVASGQRGCLRRRHDDGRASGVGCLVEGERVVGSVRRDRPRAAGNGLDQIDARTRVIHREIGQRLSDDHSRVVDSQMKRLPPTPPASSVFRRRPLTLADQRQASAVDDEVQGGAPGNASECEVEMLPAPDSVVWSGDRRSRPIRWKSEVRKPSA